MSNTKTQKVLTISKTKSKNIVNWFVNDAHWKLLADHLGLGKTAIFKYKKQMKEKTEENNPFYALGEIFTLNQLNIVIELFNDTIEHPEKYEKPKKKSEVDLKAQADVIQKHTKDMNMDYLGYENKPTAKEVDEVISELEDSGYIQEAESLTDARPSIAEERGKRPDPQPLLDLLNPIKSAGLEYFQSKNRNSASYDLNVAFAKEVAYTRRALLEDREYIGTRNAFNRLNTAFEELSGYMYERFYQLGGTPVNYHGHDDRVR